MIPQDFPDPETASDDELMAWLVGNGYFEVAFDEQGQPWFKMTARMKEDFPEYYAEVEQAHKEEINEALEHLMDLGLVEIKGVDELGEITYGHTELGKQVLSANE